ncbi:MAG: hypothetical protein GY855_07890, partial [candidate division Zixibacteria bacterium]|nr:hypothetical protein [candidate division Zixibacteria bacterium]
YAVVRNILEAKGYMLSYPGLSLLGAGSGVDRGGNYNERFSNHFRVSGTKLISVSASGTVVELGTVSGSEQVAMPYSFNTQCVIADGKMFLYSSGGGFVEVTDSDLGNPIDAVWVDGYYFLTDGEYIFHTDISDETAIDPLKFATAEFMPDPTLGLAITQDNKVIVFARYTLEYFVNVATDNFAFQRVQTTAQKIGIVATHAKCESKGVFYITGGRKEESVSIHAVTVGSSQKISSREIDKVLAEYTEPELSDMRMEARTEGNVTFIIIHLPNETLCFNESIAATFGLESAWMILKTDVQGNSPYRGINGIFDARSAKWIYGDKINSNIGVLDNDISTHYDEIVEGIFYTPFMNIEAKSIDSLELNTIPGHTTAEDATVGFSLTTDGLTYTPETWIMYGEPLDYGERFIQRRIGYVREWIGFKFRTASTSRMAFSMLRIGYG